MKQQDITLSICIASSIIFLALKLSGALNIPLLLVILPVVIYGSKHASYVLGAFYQAILPSWKSAH